MIAPPWVIGNMPIDFSEFRILAGLDI